MTSFSLAFQRSACNFSNRSRMVLIVLLSLCAFAVVGGCAQTAMRGGEGTNNPDLDAPAMSVKLDREDINYLVADYLKALEASRFWQNKVDGSDERPLVAIWPIQNATSQHIDDQLLTLLSSIETSLVNTGDVGVVDRARQADLIKEIGAQQTSVYDPATAQELGKQLGVKYFFTGKITSVEERMNKMKRVQYSLFLQVLHVETGLIEFQNEVTRTKAVKG
jgi:PBP1b-binding outer membrane lipoprotein LpoB